MHFQQKSPVIAEQLRGFLPEIPRLDVLVSIYNYNTLAYFWVLKKTLLFLYPNGVRGVVL